MNIREAILEVHSSKQADRVATYVGNDPVLFAELVKLLTGPVYRVSQRVSWPLGLCIERYPELVKPHFKTFIKELECIDSHVAVRRNIIRLLQFVEIPKRHSGRIFDICYRFLDDPKQPVAIRCFSLSVAANIARDSPELLDELRLVALKYPQCATAGFRSRTRRIFSDGSEK